MTETTIGTSLRFGRTTLAALVGDLVEQPVEALVVPANQRGVMGAGPAGAIRQAGGGEVERAVMERAPLPLGGALATTSGKLAERGIELILHAVVTERLADPSTFELIRRSAVSTLRLVDEHRLRSVAIAPFGAGLGPGQLPIVPVAEAIVEETIAHLRRTQTRLDRIVFVSRVEEDVAAFAEAIARGRERSWSRSP
jgi:O-acetyl-ADP-ribose deacetylase